MDNLDESNPEKTNFSQVQRWTQWTFSGLCGVSNYQTLPKHLKCTKAFRLRDLTHIDLRVCFLQLLLAQSLINLTCIAGSVCFLFTFAFSSNMKRNGTLRRNHRSNHSATQASHGYNNRWAGQDSVKMTTIWKFTCTIHR